MVAGFVLLLFFFAAFPALVTRIAMSWSRGKYVWTTIPIGPAASGAVFIGMLARVAFWKEHVHHRQSAFTPFALAVIGPIQFLVGLFFSWLTYVLVRRSLRKRVSKPSPEVFD